MSKSLTTTKSIPRPHGGWNIQRVTTHPGEILKEEFLIPYGLSQHGLAMKIRVPATRIGEIVQGRRAVTPDTALRLARFFGTTPDLWMNLQQAHDLSKAKMESAAAIEREVEVFDPTEALVLASR
jgi:antitoxin HigA-1